MFEHAPWVAEQAFAAGPFHSAAALHRAMVDAMRRAPRARQLALIRGHPDLAGRAAIRGELTAASSAEQAGAGLDQCTPAEFERFRELNANATRPNSAFRSFLAVKGKTRHEILAAFEQRLAHSAKPSLKRRSIRSRIARFRLDALIRS